MKYLSRPMEFKDVTEAGSFEGLASVYGNIDLGGDVIVPGAFKRENMKLTRDGHIRILDGHNTRAPIGKGILTDSHLGLVMKGQFEMAVARAREVHALMKAAIIDGLSIGYDINPNGSKMSEDGMTRQLTDLTLWEVSTTPFPMNEAARVSSVKEIERVKSVRELEDLLRDAAGLSRKQASLHASAIWKTLSGQRDADDDEGAAAVVQRMTDYLAGIGVKR